MWVSLAKGFHGSPLLCTPHKWPQPALVGWGERRRRPQIAIEGPPILCRPQELLPASTPAWKIPWMEKPGRLQSMGSLRVGHNSVTSLSLFTSMHWRRKWQPTPVFSPGESQGSGAWWAAVYGVAQTRTRLKWLSSSSSSLLQRHWWFHKLHITEGYKEERRENGTVGSSWASARGPTNWDLHLPSF